MNLILGCIYMFKVPLPKMPITAVKFNTFLGALGQLYEQLGFSSLSKACGAVLALGHLVCNYPSDW